MAKSAARRTALLGGALGALLAVAVLPWGAGALVPVRGDLAPFFWPMKSYTASRWLEGSLPLWNPLSGCGEPWLAQLQTGALYPGDLPFLLPWPAGPLAGITLHLAIAAAGMAAWLWALGASRAASLAGAAAWAGGGVFLSLIPSYNNASTAAWIPWVFLGARRAVEERRVVSLAVPLALAFLAGEPALALGAGAAAMLVAIVSAGEGMAHTVSRPPGRGALGAFSGGLLGLGLAAAALIPFASHVVTSGRATGVDRVEAMARPVKSADLADLLLPPSADATKTPSDGRGGYLLTLAFGPAFFLLAAGAGAGFPGRGRLLAVLGLVGAGAFLLSLGESGGLGPSLLRAGLLPGIRFPARWLVFSHLVFALLVGAGFDGWLHGDFTTRVSRLTARIVLALTVGLVAGTAATGALSAGRDPLRGGVVLGSALLAGGVIWLGRRSAPQPAWQAALLFAVIVLPLPLVAADPLEAVPASEVRTGTRKALGLGERSGERRVFPATSDEKILLRATLDPTGRWTRATPGLEARSLAGYTNLFERIPSASSASPIPDRRRIRFLGAALSGGNPAAILSLANVGSVISPFPMSIPFARAVVSAGGVVRYDLPSASGRLFFPKSVRLSTDDETAAALKRPDLVPDATAFVVAGPLPIALPSRLGGAAAARVTLDEPERTEIETEASSETFLVLTRTFDPGWKGMIDGRPLPLLRTNLAFTGFALPSGRHLIALRYRPAPFLIGAAISIASLLLTLSLWLSAPAPIEAV